MTGYRGIDSIFPCRLSPDNRAGKGLFVAVWHTAMKTSGQNIDLGTART